MPIWIYEIPPIVCAIIMGVLIEGFSLIGLFLTRRFLLPRFHHTEHINDAVSGTVQAIGVFYGITVGLIAIGVWNNYSKAQDLVSREASSIGSLYRDVSGYPEPLRGELRATLREYTVFIMEEAWPAQRVGKGQTLDHGTRIMDAFQTKLYSYEPRSPGQSAIHSEVIRAYNTLIEHRRVRIDAVNGGLPPIMWTVIWLGAFVSIGVAYFYKIQDARIHAVLIALMSGFLTLALLMIVINDKPFYGYDGVSSQPYKVILERLIDVSE